MVASLHPTAYFYRVTEEVNVYVQQYPIPPAEHRHNDGIVPGMILAAAI